MSNAALGERLRHGPPGLRLLLVPKDRVLDSIGARTLQPPPHVGAASEDPARATSDVAARFDRGVEKETAALRKIGLVESERGLVAAAAPPAGVFERLSLVRAIAVRLQDDRRVQDVLDVAGDRFHAVLDVRTDNDTHRDEELEPVGRAKPGWPKGFGLEEAWKADVRGNGVLVGVLDTGVDADHVEFRKRAIEFRYIPPSAVSAPGKVRNTRGFDTDGHGTHVCGIIAGKTVGLARDADLHVAAVIESETLRASLWRTVFGLDWLFRRFIEPQYVNVPCVINLSLCFYEDWMTGADLGDWQLLLGRAIEDLHTKDAVVVAAAGNRGAGFIGLPAKFDNVLAVGAVDRNGDVAAFSGKPNGTARRDIYGFGVDVVSAIERDRDGRSLYRRSSGTSMAAPYVAGIAAMLRQVRPGATAKDVRNHIMDKAVTGAGGVPIARFAYW